VPDLWLDSAGVSAVAGSIDNRAGGVVGAAAMVTQALAEATGAVGSPDISGAVSSFASRFDGRANELITYLEKLGAGLDNARAALEGADADLASLVTGGPR